MNTQTLKVNSPFLALQLEVTGLVNAFSGRPVIIWPLT